MMDNINFPKILPPLSATAGIKRVKRRKDQNRRQPFQRALQEENEKKKKQKDEEQKKQQADSSESTAVESVVEPIDGELEALPVEENDVGQDQMSDENRPKKLIDVHV